MPAHKVPITWVVDENGCHNCTSHAKNGGGYAVFRNPEKPQSKLLIHRYMYSKHYLKGKEIPPHILVRHKCDNRACVNPEHLELGSHLDNSRDMLERGRLNDRKGTANPRAKLSDDLVKQIYYEDEFQTVLAKKYNVSQVLIGMIKRKEIWKHITGEL